MSSPSPLAPKSMSMSMSISTSPIVNLVLRVIAFLFLFASLIIITTNTFSFISAGDYDTVKIHFNDIIAYRYMLFTIIIGIVYTLLQSAFAIYQATMGKRISNGLYFFDFYADKFISYTLATGAAAAFGVTIDIRSFLVDESHGFLNKANAAASLLLIAFVFSSVSSILSSLALSKRD